MKKALTSSPRYKSFIDDRNKALEYILDHKLTKSDSHLDQLRDMTHMMAQHLLRMKVSDHKKIADALSYHFHDTALDLVLIAASLRRISFGLSYLGELEAMGRAMGKRHIANLTKHRLQLVNEKPFRSGAAVSGRIALGMNRILRRAVDAVEMSVLHNEKPEQLQERIDLAFPKKKKLVYPKKVIAKPTRRHVREVARDQEDDEPLVTGFIDDDAWQEIVDAYTDAEIPTTRGPKDIVKVKSPSGRTKERYAWEVEQEITQDFLDNVRAGQVEAAQENGVTDFQWIAIIDSKTDDCCAWRDGLTSTEIREQLNGEHKGDDCDAEVPPAHFNCRCNVAPMSAAMPDEPPPDLGSFEDWLTS
jgi:hypothetical protein